MGGELLKDRYISRRIDIVRKILIGELRRKRESRKQLKILDIGCGSGQFLRLAEELSFECYGIDVSEAAVAEAAKVTKAKLIRKDIQESSGFPDEYFDIRLCLEVLEHLRRVVDVLCEINRILKPHGLLVISTPNANSLQRIISPSKNSCVNDPQHLLLFTPFTLSFLISRLGFKIEKCETYFVTLPFLNILKMLNLGGTILLIARKQV